MQGRTTRSASGNTEQTVTLSDGLATRGLPAGKESTSAEYECSIAIRPEAIELTLDSYGSGDQRRWHGTVVVALFMGLYTEYVVKCGDLTIYARVTGEAKFARGDLVRLDWPAEECLIFEHGKTEEA